MANRRFKGRKRKQEVSLGQNEFKAQGGEGSIYIISPWVYKICDPGKMIPEAKFNELLLLAHPRIIVPDDILDEVGGAIGVGYSMPEVPRNPKPLAEILSKTYRLMAGVTPEMMTKLVAQAAENLRHVHKHHGCFIVDLNEFNLMVTGDHAEIFNIDMNSAQTPTYQADAVMASIRDWSVGQDASGRWQWSQLSDWWSFAILSFYMFTAMHPFKGRHPNFPNVKTFMVEQMKAGVSVFDPKSVFPQAAVFYPFEDVIPGGRDGAYMQWYKALFIDHKRLPAPTDFQATIAFVMKVQEIIGSNNFDMRHLQEYDSNVMATYFRSNKEVVVTEHSLYINNQSRPRPAGQMHIGFCPLGDIPVLATLDKNLLQLQNLELKTPIPIQLQANAITSCEGRLYVKGERDIFEIEYTRMGQNLIATANSVAKIMPKATQFYSGVAIQDMFGTKMVSIFPKPKFHCQFKMEEIKDYRITDARYEGGVLMVVGVNRKTNQYDRLVFRFSKDMSGYDCRKEENIQPTGINFTVTDSGVCVAIDEEERVEVFVVAQKGTTVTKIKDPAIKGDMRLCHSGTQVRFSHGKKLYSFAMK